MKLENERCTGCEACANRCPYDAIVMKANEKGFFYPVILEEKCKECGLCARICPIEKAFNQKEYSQEFYSCWVKDEEIRRNSTSGGIFTAIAEQVLQDGGAVFGAAFDQDFYVEHICMENKEALKKARGAKYVQGRTKNTFREAGELLKQGRRVLYTGTPCQIAGLYAYLGKEYDELLTMDLICHGVPSPTVFQSYLREISSKYRDEISSVRFRYKKPSWSLYSMRIDFKSSRPYICSKFKDPYLRGVEKNLFQRNICFSCKYASIERVGDLTIADSWRYRAYEPESRNDQKGVSLVIINSKKGKAAFEKIRGQLFVKEQNAAYAIDGNPGLKVPWPENPASMDFFHDFDKGVDWEELGRRYFPYKSPGIIERCLRFAENYGHRVPLFIIKILKGM